MLHTCCHVTYLLPMLQACLFCCTSVCFGAGIHVALHACMLCYRRVVLQTCCAADIVLKHLMCYKHLCCITDMCVLLQTCVPCKCCVTDMCHTTDMLCYLHVCCVTDVLQTYILSYMWCVADMCVTYMCCVTDCVVLQTCGEFCVVCYRFCVCVIGRLLQ